MSADRADSSRSQLFKEPEWLGFRHEGYDVVPLNEYISIRRGDRPSDTGQTVEARARELAASTQSLLTFGLVEAVTKKRVPEDAFVWKDERGKSVMTTRHLVEVVHDWITRIRQTPEDMQTLWYEQVHTNLLKAQSLMVAFTRSGFEVFRPLGDDVPAMVCLIALIGEALVNARMLFRARIAPRGFAWSMIWIKEYRNGLRTEMLADGWCPFTVENLINTSSVSALKYAHDRGPLADGKHHGGCMPNSCAAYVVDVKTYRPKHVTTCRSAQTSSEGTCVYSGPPPDRIIQCISEGHVPVVTLLDGPDDASVGFEVHKSSDIPYIAISHVWADGLGSTTETGLPTCQLRRVTAMVSALRPGAAFWIDGICIPDTDEARKKAIKMMARTYQEAEAVLVLDGGLQLCKSTESSGTKILRVLTSGWMRRLWTLQEAALARQLHIQFADAQVDMWDLIPSGEDMLLFPHMTDLAAEPFRLIKRSRFGEYKLGDVARSVRWRSTNRPSDETLAIASLLGVQASLLVDLAPEERMIRLIREIGKMPRNVLFLVGTRLKTPGFRWAPVSLMAAHGGSTGGVEMSTWTDAVCKPLGLEGIYNVFCFPKRTVEPGKCWKVRDQKANRLYEIRDLSSEGEKYQCDMLLFAEAVPPGNAGQCASVLRSQEPPRVGDEDFTVYCEYKRRLLIVNLAGENDIFEAVNVTLSGKLRVCVG